MKNIQRYGAWYAALIRPRSLDLQQTRRILNDYFSPEMGKRKMLNNSPPKKKSYYNWYTTH